MGGPADTKAGVAAAAAAPSALQPPAPCRRYCGGPHWNRFSPSRPKSKGTPGDPTGPCCSCNQQRHYARECPRKTSGGGSGKDKATNEFNDESTQQAEASDSSDDEPRHKRKKPRSTQAQEALAKKRAPLSQMQPQLVSQLRIGYGGQQQ